MSKEIAQTVGTKRMAWLIAILAAVAVIATVGSQWTQADATTATDEMVTALDGRTASVIPIDRTIRKEVAVASYAIVRTLTTVDNNVRSASSAQPESSQTSSIGLSSSMSVGIIPHAIVGDNVVTENLRTTTASTTDFSRATLYPAMTSLTEAGYLSSFVTDTTSMSSDGALGNVDANSSLAAAIGSIPLPWERGYAVAISTVSGVEHAPHATAGILVNSQDVMSGNGSVFEPPALAATSCGINQSCVNARGSSLDSVSSAHAGGLADLGLLLLVSVFIILVLIVERRGQLLFAQSSSPPTEKWRISKRFGAPMIRKFAFRKTSPRD